MRYNSKEYYGQPNKWKFTISLFLMTKNIETNPNDYNNTIEQTQ